jgi:hypothetical protein
MAIVSAIPSLAIDTLVLLTLAAVFAASWLMFRIVSDRATYQRHSTAIADWARDHRMRPRQLPAELPQPFDKLAGHGLGMRTLLAGKGDSFLQLQPQSLSEQARERFLENEPAGAAFKRLLIALITRAPFMGQRMERPPAAPPSQTWHVYMRQTSLSWAPTGLRPTANTRSLLDLFSLTSFPLLGSTDRFVVYGTESHASERLSRSIARGLLPPDVGLLLYADRMILDFSVRPFDEIEFNRMLVLADQLEKHLAGV